MNSQLWIKIKQIMNAYPKIPHTVSVIILEIAIFILAIGRSVFFCITYRQKHIVESNNITKQLFKFDRRNVPVRLRENVGLVMSEESIRPQPKYDPPLF